MRILTKLNPRDEKVDQSVVEYKLDELRSVVIWIDKLERCEGKDNQVEDHRVDESDREKTTVRLDDGASYSGYPCGLQKNP